MATTTAAQTLTPYQVERYSRHIIMPQVGSKGQRKLMDSKVLIVGAGGLGSPISIYLALAGVGTIGIVDFDVVDLSNLQRQILHQNHDVGRRKVASAEETLKAYNPEVEVIAHEEPLTSENAMGIIAGYDIVINGADNFPARYLVKRRGVPERQAPGGRQHPAVRRPGHGVPAGPGLLPLPLPEPPPPGEVPSCAEAGVLGMLPGLVGSIQATEAVKLILGVGSSLAGRLLLIDALDMELRTVKLRRNEDCPLCGDDPTVTELIDYEGILRDACRRCGGWLRQVGR